MSERTSEWPSSYGPILGCSEQLWSRCDGVPKNEDEPLTFLGFQLPLFSLNLKHAHSFSTSASESLSVPTLFL